jgi:lipoprotein-anchoring transpeptidase ErfK/SrfK
MPLPLTRRHLLAGAAALALPRPALAEKPTIETWVVPPEHQPVTLVDPNVFALYFILEPQVALKFTVGIARGNLYETGRFYLGAKKEWPSWTPTKEMIARDPGHYAKWANGMPGGPTNPLGARALYLFDEARGDTFLRIHGTPEPWTIGSAVSNGCVRLVNEHIVMLYEQAQLGTPIVLYPRTSPA